MNIDQLNDYIIENIGMELMDKQDVISVKQEVEGWKNDEDANRDYIEVIEELEKFIEYDCLYALDSELGGNWGQGFVIIDKDLNYINFVRTI